MGSKSIKKLSVGDIDILMSGKHLVPRNRNGIIVSFYVGRIYEVTDGVRTIRVKCTQDCPTAILAILD